MLQRRIIWLLIGLLVLAWWPATAQVDVSIRLDSTELLIGDQVRMEMQLSAPAGTRIEAINHHAIDQTEGIELIDISQLLTVAEQPQLLLSQTILLTSYDSGYHVIPPLMVITQGVNGLDTAYSNDLAINVSTLPVGADDPLQGNKDIIEEPTNWWDYLPYLLALLVAGGILLGAWLIAGRKVRIAAKPPPPPPPAHVVALTKLDQLRQEELWQQGEIKAFQSELTYILREYLENRYGLTALESTTAEIDQQLIRNHELTEWREQLINLLQTADMVKFAKAIPAVDIHEKGLQEVEIFVKETQFEEQKPVTTTDE